MKKIIVVLFLVSVSRVFGSDGVTAFQQALQAFTTNGAEAFSRGWYDPNDKEKIASVTERLAKETQWLGAAIETQVFAPKSLGRHILRLYGVIYFEKKPLWVRAEFYTLGDRSGFLSVEFSPSADDILPLEFAQSKAP